MSYARTFTLSILLLLFACEKKELTPDPIRPVMSVMVEKVSGVEPRIFTGFSKSGLEIDTSFRVAGMIEKLPIKVGDRLAPNSLMAKLDATDYELEVEKQESMLERARAESLRAAAQYVRIKLLYESESASRNELDEARATNEAAKATVARAIAALDLARKQLSYTELLSPNSTCVVYKVPVEINENIGTGQVIGRLTCGDRLEIEVGVPETFIASIQKGDEASIVFTAHPERAFSGKVTKVSNVALQGATFSVTILLDQAHTELRSGMAAQITMEAFIEGEERVIVAPSVAVGEDDEGNFVYVYEEGMARKRKVTVVRPFKNRLVISSGLKEGERLITAGLRYLYDGRPVRLYEGERI